MSKTDKELATDLTITFLQSWNGRTTTKPIIAEDVISILKKFKQALSDMDAK